MVKHRNHKDSFWGHIEESPTDKTYEEQCMVCKERIDITKGRYTAPAGTFCVHCYHGDSLSCFK